MLYCDKYDILFVTETWLNSGISDGSLDPRSAYRIIRKDRSDSYGGVAAFVKRDLCTVEVVPSDTFKELELLCFDVVSKTCKVRFFNVYRPPNSNRTNLLVQCLMSCTARGHANVVVGDFNCPKIDWNQSTCSANDANVEIFNWAVTNGFTQFVNFATRGDNILDLVLSDDCQVVSCVSQSPPIGHSDHCIVDFTVLIPVFPISDETHARCMKQYNWHVADFEAIEEFLWHINWDMLVSNNPGGLSSWYAFIATLKSAIDKYVPYFATATTTHHRKTLPRKIVKLVAKKRLLWKRRSLSPDNLRLQWRYRECVNNYRAACREYAKKREENIIEANNLGAFYKHVNARIGHRNQVVALVDSKNDDAVVVSDYCKANLFNKYFATVNVIDNGAIPVRPVLVCEKELDHVEFAEQDVISAISKLKSNLSAGPDGLPPLFFKRLKTCLARPLALLFTQLFSVGAIPLEWKKAIITPIYKKGLATDVSNYRPISLTCVASKLMERIIAKKVYNHLYENSLLCNTQHGFLRGRSTCTNLLEAMNDWTLIVQSKHAVTIAYIDFSRAFDSVSHEKLFVRLSDYGIHGDLLRWLKNFFTQRTHQTRVGFALSELADLLSGVVQGSGIGPVMFLVFIDDLARMLEQRHITAKLFADDVKLYLKIAGTDDAERLQLALDLISDWARAWQLAVSVGKCNILTVGRLPFEPKVEYRIAGSAIPNTEFCRDLGITITPTLSMSMHIKEIVTKAHQRANCILRAFVSGDVKLLVRAFCTYVRPLVEHNSQIWSPSTKHDIDLVEKVQRRFTKRLHGLHNISYIDRLERLGLQSLELRRLHSDLILCYKIVFGLVLINSKDFFEVSTVTSTRGHGYKLYKSRCTHDIRKTFFAERIINVWNSLPLSVSFSSLRSFTTSIKDVNFCQFLISQN